MGFEREVSSISLATTLPFFSAATTVAAAAVALVVAVTAYSSSPDRVRIMHLFAVGGFELFVLVLI